MEVLTKAAWFGSESQRQLLSLRGWKKVRGKQQQKISRSWLVFLVMFVIGLTPSGSAERDLYYGLLLPVHESKTSSPSNKQEYSIKEKCTEKWKYLYPCTRTKLFPHLWGRDRFVFQGRLQSQARRSGRCLVEHPCQQRLLPSAPWPALASCRELGIQFRLLFPEDRAAGAPACPCRELRVPWVPSRGYLALLQSCGLALTHGAPKSCLRAELWQRGGDACRSARLWPWDAEEEQE